jgi:hypothetical protein
MSPFLWWDIVRSRCALGFGDGFKDQRFRDSPRLAVSFLGNVLSIDLPLAAALPA